MNLIQFIIKLFKRGDRMNLNKLAKRIALREGKKKQVNIAQIKEIMRLTFEELNKFSSDEVKKILDKYKR